jgi:hypothetical protein
MKNDRFDERRNLAADAKKAALEKFRAKAAELDSTFEERQAAALKLRQEREKRTAEREATRSAREAEEKRSAEQAAREAAEKRMREETEEKARQEALLAAQKAARDARYAARKKKR